MTAKGEALIEMPLDEEWIELLLTAQKLEITFEEIRNFLTQASLTGRNNIHFNSTEI